MLIILGTQELSAQGRQLIVGGGSEKNGANSWSTPPYRWAVEGKRVAIIGTETGSLAPYMKNQCGAAFAMEFAIATRDSADSQATYDTLMTYDVIFFRGGDQYEYYDFYRGTKLQDAVNLKFSQGGCIGGTSAGMHILSSIAFTAENGTVYSYECIENPNNQYVTLENDFFDLQPGFVYDTHFAERARFGRLAGFLANYKFNHDENIFGLGMDDMTCMTIDENGLGTVYGTGCANFYKSAGSFSQNGNKLLADSIEVVQLLKGCTYDFNTGEFSFSTLDRTINTTGQSEQGNYTVLASGSNLLNDNLTMITDLVTNSGLSDAVVLILSGENTLAESFKTKVLEAGASGVSVYNPTTALGTDAELASAIGSAAKILFLKNNETTFSQFLLTSNGTLLAQKLRSDGMISAFAGEDARLAGRTVVGNYLTYLSSWYGEMTFTPGLSLLSHTVIMPQTFLDSDIYENTATAVPYAMALDTLKYGIWLTNHNYMKFSPSEGKATLTGYGTAPLMVLTNEGNLTGFSQQTGSGNAGAARMVAGFEKLRMDLIDYTTPFILGDVSAAGINTAGNGIQKLSLFPNPVYDALSLSQSYRDTSWEIIGSDGRVIQRGIFSGDDDVIDVLKLTPGFYSIRLIDISNSVIASGRFIKN
ncbi:MAG: Type 1 glutamine amidotransferase-like domain-containing protein [Bacteroidales bacterium]|nr:Type 1 glutamine amidotransferase-like domain-containing protein [Bacteroidales bacterium]